MFFNELIKEVLLKKLKNIFNTIENSRNIIFCCVGNKNIYFDSFAYDVYKKIYNSRAQINFSKSSEQFILSKRIFFVNISATSYYGIALALEKVKIKFNNPYIFMIDSSISNNNIAFGTVVIKNKGLIPKSGVYNYFDYNYNFKFLGDASITCVLGKVENKKIKFANAFIKKDSVCLLEKVLSSIK